MWDTSTDSHNAISPPKNQRGEEMKENYEEQLERLRRMAAGDATWDLSDHDRAAIDTVLCIVDKKGKFVLEWRSESEENDNNPAYSAYLGQWKMGTYYYDKEKNNWHAYSRQFLETSDPFQKPESAEKWVEDLANEFLNDVACELKGQVALLIAENDRLCKLLSEK
jgi:hypothetical protein